jgi:hypothetical protein
MSNSRAVEGVGVLDMQITQTLSLVELLFLIGATPGALYVLRGLLMRHKDWRHQKHIVANLDSLPVQEHKFERDLLLAAESTVHFHVALAALFLIIETLIYQLATASPPFNRQRSVFLTGLTLYYLCLTVAASISVVLANRAWDKLVGHHMRHEEGGELA